VLVMMDASRLGRDMAETLPLQLRIVGAGCHVFHYQDGQELLLDTPTQKLVASVSNFAAEDYRYQVKIKTTDALRKKAQQGHAVGGRIYGYDNHPVTGPSGERTHSELRINERESAVVRRVFRMASEGYGIRSIATRLNEEGIPAPRSRHVCTPGCKHKKTFHGSWMATTITVLLNRELYQGRRRWGSVELEAPGLRIVDEELWRRTQQRRAKTREKHAGYRKPNGQLMGRPETPTPHLLGGLLQCACGSSMVATSRVNKSGTVRRYYACARSYKQSAGSCGHLLNYAAITDAVLSHFEKLTIPVIEQMVEDEYDRWLAEFRGIGGQRAMLLEERDRLDQELARLAEAVATGGQLPALLKAIEAKQAQRDAAAAKIEHSEGSEEAIRAMLAKWSNRDGLNHDGFHRGSRGGTPGRRGWASDAWRDDRAADRRDPSLWRSA